MTSRGCIIVPGQEAKREIPVNLSAFALPTLY